MQFCTIILICLLGTLFAASVSAADPSGVSSVADGRNKRDIFGLDIDDLPNILRRLRFKRGIFGNIGELVDKHVGKHIPFVG
uniref:RxLR effector protein n=1 Tax=Panagrellus redivivus TaxID=6233 RepID=A0A7E4UXX7_PANRE